MSCGIYKITSPSGKVYIGQSVDILIRFRRHNSNKDIRNSHLYSSLRKYGNNAHEFEIIHELPNDVSLEILHEYEKLYMQLYRSCGVQLLNTSEGGRGRKGVPMSDEQKEKLRLALKGRTISTETRFKISQSHKGKKLSEKTKAILSEINKGKGIGESNPFFGKTHSDIIKNSISSKNTGRKHSSEERAKMSKSHMGVPRTEDVKRKIREGHKRRLQNNAA